MNLQSSSYSSVPLLVASTTSLLGFDACVVSDGAWLSSCNQAGIGWILQHPLCFSILGGGAQTCVLGSALQADLTACLWAVRMALRRGFYKLLLYSNCSLLVQLLSISHITLVSVTWLVTDLRHLLRSLDKFSVRKVSRSTVLSDHCLGSSAQCRRLLRIIFKFCFCFLVLVVFLVVL